MFSGPSGSAAHLHGDGWWLPLSCFGHAPLRPRSLPRTLNTSRPATSRTLEQKRTRSPSEAVTGPRVIEWVK
ncbi:uncharacterized protein ACO6RY_02832 [Pungitius sinensis]